MTERATRVFTAEDQKWFAGASGDWNPIHVDAIAARRTLVGEQVVHGMHAVIWALDCYWKAAGHSVFNHISVSFPRPILLGQVVDLEWSSDEGTTRLFLTSQGEIHCAITCSIGALLELEMSLPRGRGLYTAARDRSFEELKGVSGQTDVVMIGHQLNEVYELASRGLGGLRLRALACLSRVVGMEVPGLHSLFSGLDVSMTDVEDTVFSYRVVRHKSVQQPIKMSVSGGGIEGTVSAFFRPPPSKQLSFADVQAEVPSDAFRDQTALVVGGSRGLGEMTAKVIAAGGGVPVLTYFHGANDAAQIASEIHAHGGQCYTSKLDVCNLDVGWAVLGQAGYRFSHLYYFATPHIGKQTASSFDSERLRRFQEFYVDGFVRLSELCAQQGQIRVFYPSTVFVDEVPEAMAEYVAAKTAGEKAAARLNLGNPSLSVLMRRLPRLDTDQNLSVLGKPPEPPMQHVLSFVQEMSL